MLHLCSKYELVLPENTNTLAFIVWNVHSETRYTFIPKRKFGDTIVFLVYFF